MEEVDGITEASKTSTEIKTLYWKEKTYKVELQSSDSKLDENNKNIMFVSCHIGRMARNNQSTKKRAFLEEGTKNKGKAMSPELKDENSRIFPGKKGVCVAKMVKKFKTTLLEYIFLSSMLSSILQGSLRNSFIVLSMVVKRDWVNIWTCSIQEVFR